jgi:hypothetical protein
VALTWPRLRTIRRSWLVSNSGGVLPAGSVASAASITPMPGSRNGRTTCGSTTWNTPLLVDVASSSSMLPSEAATTRAAAALTRIPSRRSSVPGLACGDRSSAVSSTAAGRGRPDWSSSTVGPVISVIVSWLTFEAGTNSSTVPVTRTRLPTAALAGGALLVNTNTAFDVAAFPSSLAAWMKKPLLNLRAVTMPSVTTRLRSCGERNASPWICAMVSGVAGSGSGGEEPLLRGAGAPARKSAALSLLSVAPLPWRSAAVAALSAGAGALPSKKFAPP